MFAKPTVDTEVEAAFHGARDVLRFLSIQSPQATHYLDILTTLSSAIARRRARESSTGRSRYVSKMFSLNPVLDAQPASDEAVLLDGIGLFESPDGRQEDGNLEGWAFQPIEAGELCLDWDSLNISQWDSFPFLS